MHKPWKQQGSIGSKPPRCVKNEKNKMRKAGGIPPLDKRSTITCKTPLIEVRIDLEGSCPHAQRAIRMVSGGSFLLCCAGCLCVWFALLGFLIDLPLIHDTTAWKYPCARARRACRRVFKTSPPGSKLRRGKRKN